MSGDAKKSQLFDNPPPSPPSFQSHPQMEEYPTSIKGAGKAILLTEATEQILNGFLYLILEEE